jgi:hypothetical protein
MGPGTCHVGVDTVKMFDLPVELTAGETVNDGGSATRPQWTREWFKSNQYDMARNMEAAPPADGHRSFRRWARLRRQFQPNYELELRFIILCKKIAPEMRRTIPNLIVCSMKIGDVEDERNVLKCENNLRKGTSDFIRFQTPQLDSFYRSDLRDSLLLPDQTTGGDL